MQASEGDGVPVAEAERLVQLVEAAGRLLASDDLAGAFPALLALGRDVLGADGYALWRLERESLVWTTELSDGVSAGYLETAERLSTASRQVPSPDAVFVARDVSVVEWLSPEHREAHAREGVRGLIAIPLESHGSSVGTVAFYFRRPIEGSDSDLRLARVLARLVGSALTVRELYGGVEATAAALHESEARLRFALESARVGDWELDLATDTATRSLRHDRIFGYAELLPAWSFAIFLEHVHPDDREQVALAFERALDVADWDTLTRIVWPDASIHWIRVHGRVYRDAEGERRLMLGTVEDVTREQEAHERLRFLAAASELLASSLDVETTLAGVAELAVPALAGQCIIDLLEADGRTRCVAVAHVDPAKTELLREVRRRFPPTEAGHPVRRALESGEAQFLPALDDAAVEAMAHDAEHASLIRELGNSSGVVVPLVARGRTLGAITLGAVPPQPPLVRDDLAPAQELGRRAAVAIDNALLFRAAAERAQAAQVLSNVGDGVFLLDRGGTIRLWNRAAAELTGLPADGLIGRAASEGIPGWAELAERVPVGAVGGRAQSLPLAIGNRELWLSISGVSFAEGTVYAFRDLTDERAVERMKADFISTVSHELRTPLAAIYGAALTLRREDVAIPDRHRTDLLAIVASESDRLARIVDDILWASRLEAGLLDVAIGACDVAVLARETVEVARTHLPEGIELKLDAPSGLPEACCDPDKLRQVLTNLVDNAIKYSPDGGIVRVEASAGDHVVRVAIRDEGLGIPPTEQGRIFEKFYRLDPNLTRGVGGTGLGLYISRELVRRMEGQLLVESQVDAGSVFTVELPPATKSNGAARRPPRERSDAAGLVPGRRRRVVDVGGRAPAGAGDVAGAAPRGPEDHRENEADHTDDHQDPADRVDVEAIDLVVHGERENRADRSEKDADSETHVWPSLGGCARDVPHDQRPETEFGYGHDSPGRPIRR